MYAASLPFALLIMWFVIGFGPLALLAGDRPLIDRALLAPATGVAIVTLPAFWINRVGYPVQSFATILTVVLMTASIVMYVVVRPDKKCSWRDLEVRTCVVLFCVLFAGVLAVDWPGIKDGIGWLGYANDDMAYFVLCAERVRYHGFFDPPSVASVLNGSDFSEFYAYVHERPASQIMLALAASLLRLPDPPVFMPLMIALYGATSAAVTAIVRSENRSALIAAVAAIAVVLNPLNAFSVYSELIGQAGGLAFAAAIFALAMAPWQSNVKKTAVTAILLTIVLFGLLTWYFEVVPIVFAAIGLYLVVNCRQALAAYKRLLLTICAVILAVYLLSSTYWSTAIGRLLFQIREGTTSYPPDSLIFPYFMIKAGLSSFWGLSLVSDVTPTFWVMLAGILFLISVIAVATALFEHKMIGSVTAVMATLGLFLWHKGASYGLFKASLYIQPFLAALIAEYLTRLFLFCRRWVTDRAPSRIVGLPHFAAVAGSVGLCLLLGITFIGQTITLLRYGKIATDDPDTALFNEIPGSSREGLLNQLATLARLNGNGHYVVDSYNPALTKLIVYYTRGTPTRLVSQNPFKMSDFRDYMTKLDPDKAPEFAMLNPVEFSFAWASSQENDAIRLQAHGRERAYSNDVLIATGSDNSILNRFSLGYPSNEALTLRDFAHVSNHVAFLPSNKSRPYFDYDFKIDQEEEVREYRRHVALYPNEPDYFYHGQTFAGAGRYIMLNAMNPSKAPHVLVEMTSSLSPMTQFALPPVQIVTDSAMAAGAIGRGSARLYSQPITPIMLDKLTVFGIDMGIDGRQNVAAEGAIVLDPRWLSTYVRDISLVSDEQYRALKPPAVVDQFPAGLADKALEYSGLYEDGWMAERAFLKLAAPPRPVQFVLHGVAPWDPSDSGISALVVRIDGVEKARYALQEGEFEVSFNLEPSPNPIRVDVIANRAIPLSPQDARPASILI